MQNDKMKQAATLVAALTALVTSITSLVKTLDKTLERASYEALSTKVVELQREVTTLRRVALVKPAEVTKSDDDDLRPGKAKVQFSTLPSGAPLEPPPAWNVIEARAK